MNANIDGRPTRYDMVEAHERAGAETIELGADNLSGRPRGARRLTMAQAVAAKWIARYACDDVGAVGRKAVNVDAIRH